MATYNGQQFLAEQLESIINQTYRNLEIIIRDDGSSDSTLQIIADYARTDSRIRFQMNPHNLGINANFLTLLGDARGEYVAISDQDDVWNPAKIETLMANIGSSSLIYTDSILIDTTGQRTGQTLLQRLGLKPCSGRCFIQLLEANRVSGHSCLFRRNDATGLEKWITRTPPPGFIYDMLIAMAAALRNGVHFHAQPLTYHRIHADNHHNKLSGSGERKRMPFISRKIQRIHKGILEAKSKLALLEAIFDGCLTDNNANPFKQSPHPLEQFDCCLRNSHLYQSLVRMGADKRAARRISAGRYRMMFRIF